MSIPHLFSPGAIFLNDDAASSATGLAGFASLGVSTGTEVRTRRGTGGLWETSASIVKDSPGLTFGTTQIAQLLAWTSSTWRCVADSTAGKYGLAAYLNKHDKCAARDDTDSEEYVFGNGLLVPRTLEATQGEAAVMTAEMRTIGDGSNAPMAVNTGVTLPAGASSTEEFTMYKQSVAGVDLEGCKGVQVDFGITITEDMADGTTYPEWLSVGSVATRITLTGNNPRWLASAAIPIGGKKALHSNTTLRFVAYSDVDTNAYKDLTGNHHIELTTYGLTFITTPASGGGDGSATGTELQIVCLHDGTNVPVGVTLATNLESA